MRLSNDLSELVVNEILKEDLIKSQETNKKILKIENIEMLIIMSCSLIFLLFMIFGTIYIENIRELIFFINEGDKILDKEKYFKTFGVFVSPIVILVFGIVGFSYKKEKIINKLFTNETKERCLKKTLLKLTESEVENNNLKQELIKVLSIIDNKKSLNKMIVKSFLFRDYRRLSIKLFKFINERNNVDDLKIENKSLKINNNVEMIKKELLIK